MNEAQEHREREHFFKSAKVVAVLTMLSRILGLIRDRAIFAFGANRATSTFWLAFSIPNTFRRMFGEGALSATLAAVEEGILPGGGVALLRATSVLDKLKVSGDEATGVDIVRKAVEEPIRWIAINAGRDGAVVVDAVKKSPAGVGYDAEADDFGDMVEKGIIDPRKVVRSALENAASIAAMVLITESLVTDIPEKEKMPAMPPGGMGGMGGMDY